MAHHFGDEFLAPDPRSSKDVMSLGGQQHHADRQAQHQHCGQLSSASWARMAGVLGHTDVVRRPQEAARRLAEIPTVHVDRSWPGDAPSSSTSHSHRLPNLRPPATAQSRHGCSCRGPENLASRPTAAAEAPQPEAWRYR